MSPREETLRKYDELIAGAWLADSSGLKAWNLMRYLARNDLFYLMVNVLGMWFANNDWFFERAREFEADPWGNLDAWARGHGKTSMGTHAGTIQIIINDPEATIAIFSFNRSIARGFMRGIMRELEGNERLKWLFPEIFYTDPKRQSTKWSELEGICVKRKGNPREQTVEAYGLIDSQPTSRHYKYIIFDDVVSQESVTTPEMIAKTTRAWELSLNLTSDTPDWTTLFRGFGTFYAFDDTYSVWIERGFLKPRIHAATKDGTEDGEPVFLTKEQLKSKRENMGEYIFACQMLLNPRPEKNQGFKEEWLSWWTPGVIKVPTKRIFLIDPAYSENRGADNTAIWDINLTVENGRKLLRINDLIVDKMSQNDRAKLVVHLHKEKKPDHVFEEETGAASDRAYIEQYMEIVGYRFFIDTVKTDGVPKQHRIKGLFAPFENHQIILPNYGICLHKNFQGEMVDTIKDFVNKEYLRWHPNYKVDDRLDALAYAFFSPKIRGLWPDPAAYSGGLPRAQARDWDVLRA